MVYGAVFVLTSACLVDANVVGKHQKVRQSGEIGVYII